AAVAEIEAHRAADDIKRRAGGGGDGLDQRGLAGTRFAREPVDLIGLDAQTHVVDGAYLAPYAILIDQVIGTEIAHLDHRRGRGRGHGRFRVRERRCPSRRHHALAPLMRLRRLRGSMNSFIETASRKKPMKVMTTSTTGNRTHHQTPATSAVCWLAQ